MFRRRFTAAFALIASALGCSADDAANARGGASPMEMAGEAGTGEGGSNSSAAGTFSRGQTASGGTHAGGEAGAAPDGPMSGQGGDEDIGAGGAAGKSSENAGGEATGGTGDGPPKPLYVNGCFAFVDRAGEGASRTVVWDDTLIFDPARCMRVRVGQTVTFAGDHGSHPLIPKGGDTPNPVGPNAIFTIPGIFGYECVPHPSEMNGAIEVVP